MSSRQSAVRIVSFNLFKHENTVTLIGSCLVMGSHFTDANRNNKTEILNVITGHWSTLDDYPFVVWAFEIYTH